MKPSSLHRRMLKYDFLGQNIRAKHLHDNKFSWISSKHFLSRYYVARTVHYSSTDIFFFLFLLNESPFEEINHKQENDEKSMFEVWPTFFQTVASWVKVWTPARLHGSVPPLACRHTSDVLQTFFSRTENGRIFSLGLFYLEKWIFFWITGSKKHTSIHTIPMTIQIEITVEILKKSRSYLVFYTYVNGEFWKNVKWHKKCIRIQKTASVCEIFLFLIFNSDCTMHQIIETFH